VELIVVRHGKAEPGSPTGKDEDRPLARKGERQAHWLGERLRERGIKPGILIASRYTRAAATAGILEKYLGLKVQFSPSLETDHPVSAAIAVVVGHASRSPVVIVGHNPQLSELVWAVTKGLPAREAGLKTGQAVRLEVDPKSWAGSGREIERMRMDSDD
jgi:phosphohistidine phosphatase